jgi:outer membrane protein assembly factor BamE (lipoprotein component of BamABCDE complex)
MIKILYIIFLSLIVANCSLKPVVKHHGVPYLEKKQSLLIVNETNKNDIKKILGRPSTYSKFDNNLWIYIERKQTQSKLKNLGKMKIYTNNVLVLDIDNYGILRQKKFYKKR